MYRPQIKTFWRQLAWPDAEGAYAYLSKILDVSLFGKEKILGKHSKFKPLGALTLWHTLRLIQCPTKLDLISGMTLH